MPIELTTFPPGTALHVVAQGPGMSESDCARAFDRSRRSFDPTTTAPASVCPSSATSSTLPAVRSPSAPLPAAAWTPAYGCGPWPADRRTARPGRGPKRAMRAPARAR
ncbi:hypothetical protein ACWCRD_32755 [Streptomyces sp. NPDC002092]